jgi:hypothetical protein
MTQLHLRATGLIIFEKELRNNENSNIGSDICGFDSQFA